MFITRALYTFYKNLFEIVRGQNVENQNDDWTKCRTDSVEHINYKQLNGQSAEKKQCRTD